jgi:hypothetical protein
MQHLTFCTNTACKNPQLGTLNWSTWHVKSLNLTRLFWHLSSPKIAISLLDATAMPPLFMQQKQQKQQADLRESKAKLVCSACA